GCDTCQAVCPKNKGIDFHLHDALEPDPDVAKPLLRPMLTMSNREFKEKFGHLPGFWRGKKPLQRNAIIALSHSKNTSALDELKHASTEDVRTVMRGTAARSRGKTGTEEANELLQETLEKESNHQVTFKLEQALKTTV